MKDRDLVRRKFEEFEQKIGKLKDLRREFNSLDIEEFEDEATRIKGKLRDPAKINELEAEITSLKNKINEHAKKEAKRREALNAIEILTSKLQEAEKLRIPITHYDELAKSALDKRDYDSARISAEKASDEIARSIIRYKDVFDLITKSEAAIDKIKLKHSVGKATDLIRETKAELKTGNYTRAEELAKQALEEARRMEKNYEVYKNTVDYISSIGSELTKIKSDGVEIANQEDLLEQAKAELNKSNYDQAKALAEEALRTAKERKATYERTNNAISELEARIKQARALGCNLVDAEKKLEDVIQLFVKGAYEESIEASRQVQELVKGIINAAKPEITLTFAPTSFKLNVWEQIDLTIRNNGSAVAKEIVVEYPKDRVEIEDLIAIKELNPGEETTIKTALRPIHTGKVPLKTKITCKYLDGKEYKKEEKYYISVGEIVEEKEKQKAVIEIKRGYEVLSNNDLKFGIRVVNNTGYAMMDVETMLDYPKALFSLRGSVIQNLTNIPPKGERTATYILTPLGCIHHEKIDATIFYKDHMGNKQTVQMRPKEVHCVCPFLREKPMREGEFAELADACEYVQEGLSFSGITVDDMVKFVKEACAHRLYVISEHEIDATKIVCLAAESIGEKAY